jgi:hypothetical protein
MVPIPVANAPSAVAYNRTSPVSLPASSLKTYRLPNAKDRLPEAIFLLASLYTLPPIRDSSPVPFFKGNASRVAILLFKI